MTARLPSLSQPSRPAAALPHRLISIPHSNIPSTSCNYLSAVNEAFLCKLLFPLPLAKRGLPIVSQWGQLSIRNPRCDFHTTLFHLSSLFSPSWEAGFDSNDYTSVSHKGCATRNDCLSKKITVCPDEGQGLLKVG